MPFTYQWERCDAGGANCVNISGATGVNYVLLAGDVGYTIRVFVSDGVTSVISPQTPVVTTSGGGPALGGSLPSRMPESSGTVYYIGGAGASDSNAGTNPSLPLATPQRFVNIAPSNSIGRLRTATYNGVSIYHKTNAQVITLEADAGASPILKGAAAGANNVIDVWDSQNWRIRNIEIDGRDNGGSGRAAGGIGVAGDTSDTNGYARNIEVYGCNVHDMSKTDWPYGQAGFGARGNAVTNVQVWNSRFWRVGRRATTTGTINSGAATIPVDAVGPYIWTLGGSPSSGDFWMPDHTTGSFTGTSGGNTLTGVTGITATWPSGTVIFPKNNTAPSTLDHGAYNDSTAQQNNPDLMMINCVFHDNLGWGAQNYDSQKNAWYVCCDFAYNFNGAGMNIAQNSPNGVVGCRFYNCASYHNDDGGQISAHGSGYDTFYVTSGSIPINQLNTALAYHNGGSVPGSNFIADTAGCVATNKITANPLFVADGTDATNRDFHLQGGSPALAAGLAAYTPLFDYDGNPRTNADIGAYRG